MYQNIIQVSTEDKPVLAGNLEGASPISFAEVVAKSTTVTADEYKTVTATDGKRTIYTITGLTYDKDNTDSYGNVYLKAADGTSIKVLNLDESKYDA